MTTPSDFITPGTIVLMDRGSKIYGTRIDDHDEDLTKVYIGSLKAYFGFGEGDSVEYKKDQFDIAGHEFKKYTRLLIKQNPNGLESLYTPEKYIHFKEPSWDVLIDHRDLFLSKRAFDSFIGYSRSQFKRMTRYQGDPERENKIKSLKSEIQYRENMELHHGSGNYAREPYKNFKMETLRKTINDYQGSVHSPGAARREQMESFGYSLKNATHTLRLLLTGIELLEEGFLFPDRRGKDADLLKEVRRGEWSLDQIVSYAEKLFEIANKAKEKSRLRDKPDHKKIEQLSMDILKEHFKL